jgi:hypothetical protein
VSFARMFTVTNDVSFGSKLNVGLDASFNSKLRVGNDVSFNSKFTVLNDVSFNRMFTVTNDVSFGSRLNVGLDASFNSKLSVGNDVSFNSKFTVLNDVSFNRMFTVTNDVSFGSKLNVGNDVSFNSKFYLSNASLYINSSQVNSTADELNNLNGLTRGTASASKAIVLDSNKSIAQLNVVSATKFVGTNMEVTTITGTLEGAATKYKVTNVDASSETHFLPLSRTNTTGVSSDVYISSRLSFQPNINTLTVGNINLNSKLVVANDVSFGSKLNVGLDASFNSNLAVGDTLTIKQTISSTAKTIELSANYLVIPRSNTTDTNVAGTIRYNTGLSTFEGYTASWNSLGGTVSNNKYVKIDASDNLGLTFYTGSSAPIERMRIDNDGIVQIYGDLSINGNIIASGQVTASNFYATSDYRVKDNVYPLSTCSFEIGPLKPVTYHNKVTDRTDIGLIAHEVQEHFPFLVTGEKDGDEIQTVNYTGLIGLLIHEIQQLKRRVSTLEQHSNV